MKVTRVICPVCNTQIQRLVSEEGIRNNYTEVTLHKVCSKCLGTPEAHLLKKIFGK